MPHYPRGIRLNNPGNIRKSAIAWEGLSLDQPDKAFFAFTNPIQGIRAIVKIITNYGKEHALYTIRGIINRWAPPTENDTAAYVRAVYVEMNVDPDVPLNLSKEEVMASLVKAIIHHENGVQPYFDPMVLLAIKSAWE